MEDKDNFNGHAIKTWQYVLSKDFKLDRIAFILASIIPLSHYELIGDETLVVVNMEDILKFVEPGDAHKAVEMLIDAELAKWASIWGMGGTAQNPVPVKIRDDKTRIVIGHSPNYIKATYFFHSKPVKRVVANNSPVKTHKAEDIVPEHDFTDVRELLEENYQRYNGFMASQRRYQKAEAIRDKIKAVIDKVESGIPLRGNDLLTYIDGWAAMIEEWVEIPERYGYVKLQSIAKQLLCVAGNDVMIRFIPYFALNYPKHAKKGYETITIHNLQFNWKPLMEQWKRTKNTNIKISSEDDDLV